MLSVVDLVEAGTLPRDVAAYCIAAVSSGKSFLVGASPGGAGKTTVMGALLNFVPPHLPLAAATEQAVLHGANLHRCWVCHEIGSGPYFAYLWGEPLRAWFRLARNGSMLASNLHADSMHEVEHQILGQNSVPREDLQHIGLILFLQLQRRPQGHARYVSEICESDGTSPHRLVWSRASGHVAPSQIVTTERTRWAQALLADMLGRHRRTIEEVRAAFLEAWQHLPPGS